MTLLDGDGPPFAGKGVVALLEPPDVLSRIDQLEFEITGRCLAAQLEVKREVVGQAQAKFLAGDRPTGAVLKLEIQPHAATGAANILRDLQPRAG